MPRDAVATSTLIGTGRMTSERLAKVLMVSTPFVLAALAWLVVRWIQGF